MKQWMLAGLSFFFSLLVGCGDSGADDAVGSLTATHAQNGQTVSIAKGETLTVKLAGNPTTGYQWTVAQNDADFLQPQDPIYEPDSSAIGSGGTYFFRFTALKPGTASLRMTYRRSWEPAPIETFTLAVDILETSAASLNGTSWRLTAWSANSLAPAGFGITAAFTDGQVAGHSAVNTYSGPCSVSAAGSFSTGALATTEMAGEPDAMCAEKIYLELLPQVRHYRIDQSQLILANAANQDLLIFTAQ